VVCNESLMVDHQIILYITCIMYVIIYLFSNAFVYLTYSLFLFRKTIAKERLMLCQRRNKKLKLHFSSIQKQNRTNP